MLIFLIYFVCPDASIAQLGWDLSATQPLRIEVDESSLCKSASSGLHVEMTRASTSILTRWWTSGEDQKLFQLKTLLCSSFSENLSPSICTVTPSPWDHVEADLGVFYPVDMSCAGHAPRHNSQPASAEFDMFPTASFFFQTQQATWAASWTVQQVENDTVENLDVDPARTLCFQPNQSEIWTHENPNSNQIAQIGPSKSSHRPVATGLVGWFQQWCHVDGALCWSRPCRRLRPEADGLWSVKKSFRC